MAAREFDYVIIGAGAAGCVLARRLTEDGGATVLLLEAGGWPRSWRMSAPAAWPTLLKSEHGLWRYPDADAQQPTPPLLAGKVAGGSSSVNALAYVRGHRADYDRWAQSGLTEYSYQSVLPYFRRQESWENGADAYRGGNGPIPVMGARLADTAIDALMRAAEAQGSPINVDFNGADQRGFGRTQLTVTSGARAGAATTYLSPALSNGSVQLITHARATRVIIKEGKAVGVEYRQEHGLTTAYAAREVIVSAGAVQSPQLLNLSGIGDPAALRNLGIAVEMAAPAVGQNLRNHLSVGVAYARRTPGPIHRGLRVDRLAAAMVDWTVRARGFLATPPNAAMGFIETAGSRAGVPDVQVLFLATTPQAKPYWPLVDSGYADGFMLTAVLLRPQSTGHVRLRSADAVASPILAHNFLTARNDRKTLADGLRRIDALAHEQALASVHAGPMGHHPSNLQETTLDDFVAAHAMPMFHPSGTCRMGTIGGSDTVVDPQFRVHGIERLRVVDASVMPDLVGGNLYACVTMLAEKASDLIREKAVNPA